MTYTLEVRLTGTPGGAVAVEWADREAPGSWEPCLPLGGGRWRFASRAGRPARHLRAAGPWGGIAIRYRLAAAGPWSEASGARDVTVFVLDENGRPIPLPAFAAPPSLKGTGKIGAPVAAEPGTWTGADGFAWEWRRDGAPIPGATAASYTPVAADDRTALTARVTASGRGGRTEAVTAPLAVSHVAPVAKTALVLDEVHDLGTGPQAVETAGLFAGQGLRYAVTGAGASIDPATGRVSLPTDRARSGETMTVTAGNSGGEASVRFLVTVEAPAPNLAARWQPVPKAQLDNAIARPLGQYALEGNYFNGAHWGQAALVLAFNALSGSTASDARLLAQLRHVIGGARQPSCQGGYWLQHDCRTLGAIAVARHVPRIWNALSEFERGALGALIRAGAVAGAFMMSDNNPYVLAGQTQRPLRGTDHNPGGTSRDWNPNYRLANITAIACAIAFFGPEAALAYLGGYRHDALVAELQGFRLSNTHAVFARTWGSASPSAAQIETALRQFRRHGQPLSGWRQIAVTDTNNCFSRAVSPGLNNGEGVWDSSRNMFRGRIMAGAAGLPNRGRTGMCLEFDTTDGGGPHGPNNRSSFIYCLDGARLAAECWGALAAAGVIDPANADIRGIRDRMDVGYTDLAYKWDQGYFSYSKGGSGGGNENWTVAAHGEPHGRLYSMGLWRDVLRPWFFG